MVPKIMEVLKSGSMLKAHKIQPERAPNVESGNILSNKMNTNNTGL